MKKVKLRFLILSHISELLGGAERSMLEVLDVWAKEHGVVPEFILRKPVGSLGDAIKSRGWKYHIIDFTFWSHTKLPDTPEKVLVQGSQNARAVELIEEIIRQVKPDAVITNSVVAPWAALAAHFRQVPHVWFIREYGDLDHGRDFELGREQTLQDVGNLSALVVANSRAVATHLSQYIDSQKVTTLYPPLSLGPFEQAGKESVPDPFVDPGSLKLIISGNVGSSKGQLETVEAVGRLTEQGYNIELCIIGDPGEAPIRHKITASIKRYSLQERVHLLGYRQNPIAYAKHADAGIMAARMEAFGRVTFEYLAAGIAVIGTNSGATPEMVVDGQNGLLFTPGDAAGLAGKIKQYADNPALLKKHARKAKAAARAIVNSPYSASSLYPRMVAVIQAHEKTKLPPIYMLERLVHFQAMANRHLLSLRPLIYLSLRRKAKKYFLKLRKLAGYPMKG